MNDMVLAIRMKADSGELVGEVRSGAKSVSDLKKEFKETGRAARDDAGRGIEGLQRTLSGLKTTIAALGVGALLRDIARTGIEFQKFETGLTAAIGSAQGAQAELGFLREEAERLGLRFTSLADSYTQLAAAAKGTALEGKATREIFSAVAEASRVMGLSSAEAEGALRAIGQMMSKGTVQAEELRGQLGERIPGAFQLAARAMGVTTAELGDMLQEGEVLADELLPKLAKELRKAVNGGLEGATNSPAAQFERMGNALDDLKQTLADGGLLAFLADLAEKVTLTAKAFVFMLDQLGIFRREVSSLDLGQTQLEIRRYEEDLIPEFEGRLRAFHRARRERARSAAALPGELGESALESTLGVFAGRQEAFDEEQRDLLGRFEELKARERVLLAGLRLRSAVNQGGAPSGGGAGGGRSSGGRGGGRGRRSGEAKAEEDLTLKIQEEFDRRRDAYIESLSDRLDGLRRSLDSEVEAERRRHRDALLVLDQAEQQRLTSAADVLALREELEEQHLERIYQLSERQLERTTEKVNEETSEMRDLVREVGLSFSSAFEEAVTSGGKLRDVLSGLADDLAKLALRKGVTEPLLGMASSFFDGIFGGSAALPADYGGFPDFSLAFHEGGVVGRRSSMRAVDPRVFEGAPRYHSGGLVADERPAVLKVGEEVLTRGDPRHSLNGGANGVTIRFGDTHIDARGADQGVEQRLRVALERNKRETIAQVRSEIVRGGPLSRMVRG